MTALVHFEIIFDIFNALTGSLNPNALILALARFHKMQLFLIALLTDRNYVNYCIL